MIVEGEELHHISDVNRLRVGSEMEVTDGRGWVHLARIDALTRYRVSAVVLKSHFSPKPPPESCLAVSLLKGKAMNFIVERLTEMGIDRIIPVVFYRSDVQRHEAGKAIKWIRIAEQAIKVSDNPWLPVIEEPVPLSELLSRQDEFKSKTFLDLDEPFRVHGIEPVLRPALALIGPPGGVTGSERSQIKAAGYKSFRICQWTLRSETAAMVAAAWLDLSKSDEVRA